MDFYARQEAARRTTRWLLLAFLVSVVLVVLAVDAVVFVALGATDSAGSAAGAITFTSVVVVAIICGASLFKTLSLRSGGGVVARSLGGTRVERSSEGLGLRGLPQPLSPPFHVGGLISARRLIALTSLSFCAPDGGVATVLVGGLAGAGEFVGDVARRPGGFSFVGADPDPQPPDRHLGLGPLGLRPPERAPGRPPRRIRLDLARFRGRAERVCGVLVPDQVAVRRDRRRALYPLATLLSLGRERTEGFTRPLGLLSSHLLAEFGATLVGCVSEDREVGAPLRVVDLRHPPGVGLADGVEGGGFGDAAVEHVGDLPRIVQTSAVDRVGQDPTRVVPGQFGAAQHGGEGGGAVLGGQLGPLGR